MRCPACYYPKNCSPYRLAERLVAELQASCTGGDRIGAGQIAKLVLAVCRCLVYHSHAARRTWPPVWASAGPHQIRLAIVHTRSYNVGH